MHSRHPESGLSSTLLCVATFASSFFFKASATTWIYTLSLHDALPISRSSCWTTNAACLFPSTIHRRSPKKRSRSEEHTSELQSHHELVCRLLLEKKNPTPRLRSRARHPCTRRRPRRYTRRHSSPRCSL